MRFSVGIAALVLHVACRPPAPAEPSAQPEPEPSLEPEAEPQPEPEPESAPKRCALHDDVADLEACLGAVPPPGPWSRVADPAEPFGYVCVLFGLGDPRCEGEPVRLVARWDPVSPTDACPTQLSLYFAPMQNPSAAGRDLGNGGPGKPLEPVDVDSDGVRFSYLRVDDFIVEGRICLDDASRITEPVTGWAERLQPELYP